MLAALRLLFGFLGGGTIKTLAEAYAKKKDSVIESERIEAEWLKAKLEAQLQIRMATAGFWEMRVLTFLIAGCFTLHLVLVTFDTVTTNTRFEIVGWNVPALPAPFDGWQGAILLSFFGLQAGVASVKSIAGAIAARKR